MMLGKSPRVSVIMSVYNGERFLREAIDSILNQTFKNFEFIVVNDGSTDNTQEILTSYNDKRMVLLNNQQNVGVPLSRNKGMKVAQGEYIAVMDADDISLPDRLEEEVKFLDQNKDIGLAGTFSYVIDMTGTNFSFLSPPTTNEGLQKKLRENNCFIHSSVMFRRECLERVGDYREEFETSHDYDLLVRISEKYKVANIEKPLCKWRLNLLSTLTVAKKLDMNEECKLIRELARERRLYGKDRLQMPEKRQEVIDYINSFKKKNTTRRAKSESYLNWARTFRVYDIKTSLDFLIKSFISDPFYCLVSLFAVGIRKILKEAKKIYHKDTKTQKWNLNH